MRRFKDIIEDIKAPSIQNLWLNGGKLKYYGENGWQDIKGQGTPTVKWDDIEDKPKTFTPSSHTHTKSDITDFPTESLGGLKFQYIQEVPDIIIETQ